MSFYVLGLIHTMVEIPGQLRRSTQVLGDEQRRLQPGASKALLLRVGGAAAAQGCQPTVPVRRGVRGSPQKLSNA